MQYQYERFLEGDYIVLVSCCSGGNSWHESLPELHCYQLDRESWPDERGFSVKKDIHGRPNGWHLSAGINAVGVDKLNFRKATEIEILKYKEFDGPFSIRVHDCTPKKAIEADYLADMFNNLNIS